ncbi:MAG TPA: hypothetical protein DCS07_13940, partial [Bdellovibrionales bacterium]|nr:hypothetical protein [Bdellovibrionales bacterium]
MVASRLGLVFGIDSFPQLIFGRRCCPGCNTPVSRNNADRNSWSNFSAYNEPMRLAASAGAVRV